MSEEKDKYGYEELRSIPNDMKDWKLRLKRSNPSQFGAYVLVGCEPATIAQSHQVIVLDEQGQPLPHIQVVFSFRTGIPIGMPSGQNHWEGGPTDVRGYAQRTDTRGYSEYVTGVGGEDIFVWDIDAAGDLKLPSGMATNCLTVDTSKMPALKLKKTFHIHGVKLAFQRRKVEVSPKASALKQEQQNA